MSVRLQERVTALFAFLSPRASKQKYLNFSLKAALFDTYPPIFSKSGAFRHLYPPIFSKSGAFRHFADQFSLKAALLDTFTLKFL